MTLRRPTPLALAALAGASALAMWMSMSAAFSRRAFADDPASLVEPIYAHMPDAPQNDVAQRELTRAAARYKLLPVEVVDIEMPPPPQDGSAVKAGVDL